jgi:translation initiation factor IF-3
VPKVTVIDDLGQNLGLMDTSKAIEIAREKELDLVEVSPNLNPPVCKIMDYGKHRYKVSKQTRQHNAKQKKVETKNIRFSVRTEGHDLDFKARNVTKFMAKGHRVKAEVVLKGREKANVDFAEAKFRKFLDTVAEIAKADPLTAEKEMVRIQDVLKSPQGFSAIVEFKRS